MCGNHISKVADSIGNMGSPPRVREPLGTIFEGIVNVRITPACAGTTSHRSS